MKEGSISKKIFQGSIDSVNLFCCKTQNAVLFYQHVLFKFLHLDDSCNEMWYSHDAGQKECLCLGEWWWWDWQKMDAMLAQWRATAWARHNIQHIPPFLIKSQFLGQCLYQLFNLLECTDADIIIWDFFIGRLVRWIWPESMTTSLWFATQPSARLPSLSNQV